MKKRILLVLLAIVMTFSLASCDKLLELIAPPHDTHEFGNVWQADDIEHWLECECGEKSRIGEHTGGIATTEEQARCEICGFQYGALATEDVNKPDDNNNDNGGNNNGNTDDNGNNNGNTPDDNNTDTITASAWVNLFAGLTNFTYDEKFDGEIYYTTDFDGDKLVCYDYDYQDETYFYKKNGVYYYAYLEDGAWVEYEDDADYYLDYAFALDYVEAIKNGYSSFTYNDGKYTATNVTLSGNDFTSIKVYIVNGQITLIELAYTLEYDGETYTCNDRLYNVGTATVKLPTINGGNSGDNTGDNGNTGNNGSTSTPEWTDLFSSLTNFIYDETIDGEIYYTTNYDGSKVDCYDYYYEENIYFYLSGGVYYYVCLEDGAWVEYEDEDSYYLDYTFALDYIDAIKNGYSSFTYNASAGTYTASNVTLSGYDFTSIKIYVANGEITSIELSYTIEYEGDTYNCNDRLYGVGTANVTIPTVGGGNTGDNTGDNGGNNGNQGGNTDVNTGSITSEVVDFNDSLDTNGPMTDGCLPSTGNINVLVIPINLTSTKNNAQLKADLEIAFNGTQAQTGWYSVKEYYSISSYGQLNLTFDILDWYTPSKSASYYDSYYNSSTGYYGSTLILDEVLKYYDSTIDFSRYDSNGDTYIDAIWLIYNYDVNYESDNSDYWAYVYQTSSDIMVDGVCAYYYGYAGTDFMYDKDTFYNSDKIKVDAHTYIHETGHMMGLDDYYDYDESVGATGGLYCADMMDANIGDHASINKLLLNWINPTVITGKGSVTLDLASFASSGQAILITPYSIDSIYNEYILIEFYTSTLLNANDEIYYDETTGTVYGIRVLHVDANVYLNSNGEIDYNSGSYMTGFKYDNSDESKLFVDTLYCVDIGAGYATSDMLFTMNSATFNAKYPTYKLHDGTVIDLDIVINSMTIESANITITIN